MEIRAWFPQSPRRPRVRRRSCPRLVPPWFPAALSALCTSLSGAGPVTPELGSHKTPTGYSKHLPLSPTDPTLLAPPLLGPGQHRELEPLDHRHKFTWHGTHIHACSHMHIQSIHMITYAFIYSNIHIYICSHIHRHIFKYTFIYTHMLQAMCAEALT